MSPDEQLERFRMCIAEAGYDPAAVELFGGEIAVSLTLPLYVTWKASALAGLAVRCWPCRAELGVVQFFDPAYPPCDHPVDPFCPEHVTEPVA